MEATLRFDACTETRDNQTPVIGPIIVAMNMNLVAFGLFFNIVKVSFVFLEIIVQTHIARAAVNILITIPETVEKLSTKPIFAVTKPTACPSAPRIAKKIPLRYVALSRLFGMSDFLVNVTNATPKRTRPIAKIW